jgi:four helix bundle protein
MKNYRDLEIYQISMDLFLHIHPLTLKLPKYEMYELGSQLRRSADSIHTNIVEGYGRRRYQSDFIRFLVFSHASNLETGCHIEKLMLLYPQFCDELSELYTAYDILGAKIHAFIQYVEKHWNDLK